MIIINRLRNYLLKQMDANAGAAVCRLLGGMSVLTGPQQRRDGIDPAKLKRVLLIRPGGLGDMVMLIPAIHLLQKHLPTASIDILCEKRNAELAELLIQNGIVHLYDRRPFSLPRRLRAQHYSLVIDTEQFHHLSAITALLTAAPLRIGFNLAPRRNPLYTHPVHYRGDAPEDQQFLRLLTHLGIDPSQAAPVVNSLSKIELPALPQPLKQLPENSWIVVHTAAGNRYKRWPVENFAVLKQQLETKTKMTLVFVGENIRDYPHDMDKSGSNINLCGKISLLEVFAVIRNAALFVGTDSGLAHMAAALNTPSVTLFGSTDPVKWGHSSTRHTVIHYPMACAPCALFGYHKPCRDVLCMREITPEQVTRECLRLLQSL